MVWFLLLVGMLLIVLNFKAIRKEQNSFQNVLQFKEEDMTDFEFALGELRREFSETILELQTEMQHLKEKNNTAEKVFETKEVENINEKSNIVKKKNTVAANIGADNSVKIDEISKLLAEGLSLDEISVKLGIGKGEVLLIKELYIK